MTTIPEPEIRSINDGVQRFYTFPNGYGASVVQHSFSYGRESGLWELAVIGRDGHLCYDTPITCDVIGHLTLADADDILRAIAELP